MLIGMKDVRSMNWCRKGAKEFCDRNGISWDEFRTVGVDEKVMLDTKNALAIQLVEKASENGRR